VVLVSLFSAAFGAWTGLAILQVVSGRFMPWKLPGSGSWTQAEVRASGIGWAICGLSGVGMALVAGLEFGAHVIPTYWVGSPWGIVTGNPWILIFLGNLLFQWLIALHHWRPSRRSV
jgi:hypothetical protein